MYFDKITVLIVTVLVQCHVGLSETVNLTIANGDIQGSVNTTYRQNNTYYSFRGIPYAQPPVGELRFAAPVKNGAWNGTYDATYDRNGCVETTTSDYITASTIGDEDCLYINVYTRDLTGNASVVVWIYGGAFLGGNSSYASFGPDNFLDQEVVFVSFNYRLGVFGFLSTGDEVCPGNWGIKDQILALKWVQENIGYFGGNPDNVTIFGESAGAVSVNLLMQTPLTAGLFKGAIMNSGTTLNLWSLTTRANATALLLSTDLGIVSLGDSSTIVNGLREIEAYTLNAYAFAAGISLFVTDALRGLPWGPVYEPDIEGAVYVNPSEYALSQGNFTPVPVLMGINSNEAGSAETLPEIIRFYLLYYDLQVPLLTPYSMTDSVVSKLAAGNSIKLHYFGLLPIASSLTKLAYFISADQFNRPVIKAAYDMSSYTTVYFYEFGYQGILSGVTDREYEGVGHAEDIKYFFRSDNNATDTDLEVSGNMILLWSNFVKYGNPTPWEDEQLNNTIWEPVDSCSCLFSYLSINQSIVMSVDPKDSDWKYYNNLWDTYGDGDEYTTY